MKSTLTRSTYHEIIGCLVAFGCNDLVAEMVKSNDKVYHTVQKPEINADITKVIKQLVKEFGKTPFAISNGECNEFADALVRRIGGGIYELTVEAKLPQHAWVKWHGRYYDAETPRGVLNWKQLPIFKRLQESKSSDYNPAVGPSFTSNDNPAGRGIGVLAMDFRQWIKNKTFRNPETKNDVEYWSLPLTERDKVIRQFHMEQNSKNREGLKSGKASKDVVRQIQEAANHELGISLLSDKDRKRYEELREHLKKWPSLHMEWDMKELGKKADRLGARRLGDLWSKFGKDYNEIHKHLKDRGANGTLKHLKKYMTTAGLLDTGLSGTPTVLNGSKRYEYKVLMSWLESNYPKMVKAVSSIGTIEALRFSARMLGYGSKPSTPESRLSAEKFHDQEHNDASITA